MYEGGYLGICKAVTGNETKLNYIKNSPHSLNRNTMVYSQSSNLHSDLRKTDKKSENKKEQKRGNIMSEKIQAWVPVKAFI